MSEVCCTRLAENTGRKTSPKIRHLRTTFSGCIFATKAHINNRTKNIKHQYLVHTSSQYSKLRPISGWDQYGSLGHLGKFQRVSCVGFVTAPTSLNGRKPNFAQCLAVSWAGTLYIHFRGLLPLREFCQVQNSLCVKVLLHCPILAALLHCTVGVSQIAAWYRERN